MAETENAEHPHLNEVTVELDRDVISVEALLKTCHWFSRDYVCEIRTNREHVAEVVLTPRNAVAASDPVSVKDAFTTSAIDFALRERIEAKTAGIRDLLLAKAFSEAGVLEDQPEGLFGDAIEEAKPEDMFKILGNP